MNSSHKAKLQSRTQRRRRQYTKFPYVRVAKMWARGLSIAEIARKIARVDKNSATGDLYHSLRNFLYRMHKGYRNANGKIVRLPYRVAQKTVRASRAAGLRAW